jgi:hypothetical protein
MKTLIILFLVFILSIASFAQKKTKPPTVKLRKTFEIIQADIAAANKSDCWANYDKFDDKTFVFCKLDSTLTALFSFKGRSFADNIVKFFLRAESSNSVHNFTQYRKLQIILDKERVNLNGNYLYQNQKEMLFFDADKATLQKIADSEIARADYRVGLYESFLTASERRLLRFLITLGTPY